MNEESSELAGFARAVDDLAELAGSLGSSPKPLRDAAQSLTKLARSHFRNARVQFLIHDGEFLRMVASNPPVPAGSVPDLPIASCFCGRLISKWPNIDLLYEPDVTAQPQYFSSFADTVSELAVVIPVRVDSTTQAREFPFAVLNFESPSRGQFSRYDHVLARAFARHSALILQSIDFIDGNRALPDVLSRFATCPGSMLVEQAIETILGSLSHWCPALQHIEVATARGRTLEIIYSRPDEHIGTRIDIADCACGDAFIRSDMKIISYPNRNESWHPRYKKLVDTQSMSESIVPIGSASNVVGVINVESDRPYVFNDYVHYMLQRAANAIRPLVEYQNLSFRLARLDKSRNSLERLAALGGFMARALHETKQFLQEAYIPITGALNFLHDSTRMALVEQWLLCAKEAVNQARNQLPNAKLMVENKGPFNLLAAVRRVLDRYSSLCTRDGVACVLTFAGWPVSGQVSCRCLEEIIADRIRNSLREFKTWNGERRIRIDIRSITNPVSGVGEAQLIIENSGPPMLRDRRELDVELGGFGLWLTEHCVNEAGGSFETQNLESGDGVQFSITLPRCEE